MSNASIDQITLDIMWGRLIATVNEQAAALVRSSFTSIVRDAGDLSACVFDRRGWRSALGFPGFIPDPGADPVPVKLLVADELPSHSDRIDKFEGEDYLRVSITVDLNETVMEA